MKSKHTKTVRLQDTKEDVLKLKDLFLEKKKKLIKSFIWNLVLVFLVMAIIGTKLFYPYHFLIGGGLYLLSWGWFVIYLVRSRALFKKFKTFAFAQSFYKTRKWRIFGTILFCGLLWMLHTIFPWWNNPFAGLTSQQIEQQLQQDSQRSLIAMDQLDISGQKILEILPTYDNTDKDSQQALKTSWDDFVLAVVLSEDITERYKYFHRLEGEQQKKAFVITYSLYLRKQAYIHKILNYADKNPLVSKVLNEEINLLGRQNVFRAMSLRFYNPKTIIRINLGRVYLQLVGNGSVEAYTILHAKAIESYTYLANNLEKTFGNSSHVVQDGIEHNVFENWLPLQKNIANVMGNIRFTDRYKGFITQPQIKSMQQEMQPGDIMVQRRNWYLSNVGIPGFWAHAALYTGTLSEMNDFFQDLFPYQGYETFEDYLKALYPDIYQQYQQTDEEGYAFSVIEAVAPGVVLTSIEQSADADFVGVLRPNISKEEVLKGLIESYAHAGKPYDYNFDFDTNDALVCSELVYKSYQDVLQLETQLLNGRTLLPPVDLVQKYDRERETESPDLSFVYFLKGEEVQERAVVSDEETFYGSWKWPKFSFQQ